MTNVIDAKALREKIEGLYKGKDLTQDDKKILRYDNLSIQSKERWENLSDNDKAEFSRKVTAGKLTISKDQADEIWFKLWGADRGSELYKKLALEYNVAYDAVFMLALGDHPLSPVDRGQWQKIHNHWHSLYGYNKNVYIVRSPGNDLLDFYDKQNLLRGYCKKSKLSPSEIFDIRFRWDDKSRKAIKTFCDAKGIKVDGAMYITYATKTFGWLVDCPHKEWEFNSFVKMSEWLFKHANKEFKGGGQLAEKYVKLGMIWMDKGYGLNGWSFIKKETI